MKKPMKTLAMAIMLTLPTVSFASHHFESAAALADSTINQLDNYVFQSTTKGNTVFLMTVNNSPKAGPGGVFNPNALYNIHVASDDAYKVGHTFSFKFDNEGNFTVYDLNQPDAAPGVLGDIIGKGTAGHSITLANGIKVWTGSAEDPFFGNSPGLHAYRAQLAAGKPYDANVWTSEKGNNIFAARTSGGIVIEVPDAMLGKSIKVFMTTALSKGSSWEQVQYSANPLFSHSMLFENEALKREHDQSRPENSADMKNFVSARTARASFLANSQNNPFAYGDKVADMLVPDVLTYRVGTTAHYTMSSRNGRGLGDDAMGAMLSLLVGKPVNQAIVDQKRYSSTFPYLIPADLKK
ncbi:DUF4331 domain-containing protein [Serratia proteamaculans]|uniref:DUF4331 family protein n=1 Tax=Serratia proteamaculans TaxID=28151 RepID=UPI001075DB1B|nr:DUF4331 family protein [Serratia proteamaculans]TFZ52666.1 DUF4331 domain-containing protein [Serratia proteamaculans]